MNLIVRFLVCTTSPWASNYGLGLDLFPLVGRVSRHLLFYLGAKLDEKKLSVYDSHFWKEKSK